MPNLPVLGDIATIGLCDDVVDAEALNAASGAMVTWDFSGLNETSEEQIHFVDPSSTPLAPYYPNSNLCSVGWAGTYDYYIVESGIVQREGSIYPLPGTPPPDTARLRLNPDRELIFTLPFTYGDNHSDAFSGILNTANTASTILVDGTIDQDVDGYGTLMLPNATYTNVVRYHFNEVQNNTVIGGPTTTLLREHWAWVSADHRFWLLVMEINDDGLNTSDIVWYDKAPALAGPTAIAEADPNSFHVRPNPVTVGSPITIHLTGDTFGTRAELTDATGRLVRTYGRVATTLATDGLMAGAYVLRLTDSDGTTIGTTRVILR